MVAEAQTHLCDLRAWAPCSSLSSRQFLQLQVASAAPTARPGASGWPGGHRLQQPSLSAHWDMGHKQSVTCMASSPTEQGPPCMGGLGHGSCHAAKLS